MRTFRRYYGPPEISSIDRDVLFRKVLANDAIEQIVVGPLPPTILASGLSISSSSKPCAVAHLDDSGLVKLSKDNTLALSLDEMKVVQSHFRELGANRPTWNSKPSPRRGAEHCSHKTLARQHHANGSQYSGETRTYKNLLKETVFAATQTIRTQLGRTTGA